MALSSVSKIAAKLSTYGWYRVTTLCHTLTYDQSTATITINAGPRLYFLLGVIIILSLFESPSFASHLKQIEEIFFLSSSRTTFSSETDKKNFFHLWIDYYLEIQKEQVWLWVNPTTNAVSAYLMGCFDSQAALSFYADRLLSYSLFQDLFTKFPAHLHINSHPLTRGQGLGMKLIDHFKQQCVLHRCVGLHIVTSPQARNVSFYRRCGFEYEVSRKYQKSSLLFMACDLTSGLSIKK